jgi:hypothetical protein
MLLAVSVVVDDTNAMLGSEVQSCGSLPTRMLSEESTFCETLRQPCFQSGCVLIFLYCHCKIRLLMSEYIKATKG